MADRLGSRHVAVITKLAVARTERESACNNHLILLCRCVCRNMCVCVGVCVFVSTCLVYSRVLINTSVLHIFGMR